MAARIVIQEPSPTGGRRVRVDGEILGLAHSDADVIEFLRRAGLPDSEALLDDPTWVEWRGGVPHDYGGPSLSSA
ncbi:hypothetical protein OEIGOIKO_05731 [Streptomyces chrestomyceticus JCM 4735]|uniref:Uncharacterized protein n=1 Tax=Streptomyces chrestomyceticus JCM 4735 TaxID=1306181 RepID=A0A7U9KZW3_9ACTN|nr:hypothetical protein [Streptomyces chrestomyceticus]GCD37921.1 hypothetical protein OEIGOIKO_05731 [Streptomyces chrestomyceticus JCM 4735]